MRLVLLLSILLLVMPLTAFGGVYGYTDSEGTFHITNIKPAGKGYRILVRDAVGELPLKGNFNQYDGLINQHALANGLDPALVKAVMLTESNSNPAAVSRKGAQGLMQIMPDTAQIVELKNPFDPDENIRAGARYLKLLQEMFSGDLELVLAAYNAGPTKVIQHNMKVPPISETVNYVKQVKLRYDRLKNSQ
ncbi:MAG TPA: lytic transglycosylase domain-containing protein [Syntrophorhabdales bacterium]|nr:lytic transglycosylase domain-containing protein [Syntrophorhabdales bacterium]